MGFIISSDFGFESTHIPNSFIKQYMPSANGNYVKIYLYLMMVNQQTGTPEQISINHLADQMECTENDIARALHYWQREGLLGMEEKNGEITSILLHNPVSDQNISTVSEMSAAFENTSQGTSLVPESEEEFAIPDKQHYTPLQAEALMKDEEINSAISAVEQILGEPVSPAHLRTILYFMCDVGFSQSLLITLYQTAARKGKKQPGYIEAIGISWAKKGIHTPEQATEESAAFHGKYTLVSRSFGIQRPLAPAEREIIDSWDTYHFSDSIIEEACKRTVLQTGNANLNYASKILKNWHSKQVVTLQDIEKCDESHKRQSRNSTVRKNGTGNNPFQKFPQRSYSQKDYRSLEQQLLQGNRK